MSRSPSHRPRLSEAARVVRDCGLLPEGARVLAACSGGADSTGLVLGLAELAGAERLTLEVAHVHHGIRPAEADADAARVGELCRHLGLPFHLCEADAIDARRLRRRGLEEAARAVRREALERVAEERGLELIALAHTLDDQAETLLLHLLRGAGPDGLAAMRPRTGRFLRPLLQVRRDRVRNWLVRAGVPWASDRTNWADSSARALLRPWLQRGAELFNESLIERLATLAGLFAEDADFLDSLAVVELDRLREVGADLRGGAPSASLRAGDDGLAGLPPALARRVARRFLRELDPAGAPARADAVERVLRLASEDPGSERTGHVRGCVLRREGRRVVAGGSARGAPPPPARELPIPGELDWGGLGLFRARRLSAAEAAALGAEEPGWRRALVDGDRLPERLTLRCRRRGDRFHPTGSARDRSLAAWMRERRIPRGLRDGWPLVVDSAEPERVAWAAEGPPAHGLAPGERNALVVVLEWRPHGATGETT